MPSQIIVNKLAIGGNQAAKDIMPVEAAAKSKTCFPSLVIVSSYQGTPSNLEGLVNSDS